MKTSAILSLTALAGVVNSMAVNVHKRAAPLKIDLEMVGNTKVKATVTNTGSTALNLLSKGTFLDSKPVEKVQVYQSESKVAFEGMRFNILRKGLTQDAFTLIPANSAQEVEFDIAELHNLAAGGEYTIVSQGAIPYAQANSTELSGSAIVYKSNALTINVDGAKAARVEKAIHRRLRSRTSLGSDCTGSEKSATEAALGNCADLASAASSAASSGSADKFSEYFKTTSSSTRSTVAARLSAVADECSSTSSGSTEYHCTDTYDGCESNVLAYTLPSENYLVNCPLFFSDLPALSSGCHDQDQATTVLHEMCHAPGVYSPGTDDLGYGYAAATALSTADALNNADSFALYSNAIYAGC